MRRLRLLLCILALACLRLPAVELAAQQHADDHGPHTCGSDWARHLNFSVVPDQPGENNRTSPDQGIARTRDVRGPRIARSEKFYVAGQMEKVWGSVMAAPVYRGSDVMIWLADEYYDSISQETINRLATGLEVRVKPGPATRDQNKGVITNNIEMFGEPARDRWSNGKLKVHILLMEIGSPIDGGAIDGYFSPHDQTTRFGSNERNLLYIDVRRLLHGKQMGIDHVLGTVAHEFQHLINYHRYPGPNDETHWIYNEGLSEVACIRNGYWSRNAGTFLNSPNKFGYFNAPVGSASADSVLRAYERAMLWTYYLAERFGERFLYELVAATGTGIEPVRSAMRRSGHGGDAESVMTAFWAANYLQGIIGYRGDPMYTYDFPISSIPSGTVSLGGLPSSTRTEAVNILEYAAYYPQYGNPDPRRTALKVRFHSGASRFGVHAIISRPDNSIDVRTVDLDRDQIFTGFTNITFAIANVSSQAQTVRWQAEMVESGMNSFGNGGSPDLSNAEASLYP